MEKSYLKIDEKILVSLVARLTCNVPLVVQFHIHKGSFLFLKQKWDSQSK